MDALPEDRQSKHLAALLCCRYGKGADASHDICNHLPRLEQANQPGMLLFQARVPVHL